MKKELLIMTLTRSNLENNKYYFYSYSPGYIIKVRDNRDKQNIISDSVSKNRFLLNRANFTFLEGHFRPATQEEMNWLNACIQAEKFIPFDEVNQSINYEIY